MGTADVLWYIPNDVKAGHRGDAASADHNSLDTLTAHAKGSGAYGWSGALLGAGWGRPDTFTPAARWAARTERFKPLIAIRPGYWRPAQSASAGVTLDQLSGGRVRVNVVSGKDDLATEARGQVGIGEKALTKGDEIAPFAKGGYAAQSHCSRSGAKGAAPGKSFGGQPLPGNGIFPGAESSQHQASINLQDL